MRLLFLALLLAPACDDGGELVDEVCQNGVDDDGDGDVDLDDGDCAEPDTEGDECVEDLCQSSPCIVRDDGVWTTCEAWAAGACPCEGEDAG